LSQGSLEAFARNKLRSLARRHLERELAVTVRHSAVTIERDGERLVSFACNDYLGLAHDPATRAAAIAATEQFGTGAGASRLISGSHSLYGALEQQLAALKATEDAVVFGSGYLANIGLLPLFCGRPDLILVDALAHSSLLAGARLSGATLIEFPHNDVGAAAALLDAHRRAHRHCLLLTEGVFSMDGDLAPLPALAELAARHDAWLLSDDAHGLGVVGGGRGAGVAHAGVSAVPLQMGTLSKAVGAYGGYLCASRNVCELVRNRARSFVYSTGLPPGTVAAAAAGLTIIATDAARVARPLALARRFTAALNLPPAASAIVPLPLGGNREALAASAALRRHGYFVAAIRPPTVPAGTARLRFTFSAAHADADVDGLIAAVRGLEPAGPAPPAGAS
jgi:8-amino-7-oxononanoate synthase